VVLGLEGSWEAVQGGQAWHPQLHPLSSLHRLDNVHGSRVEPSETARMNSMDRHIQQTNDRLQCIKQVGVQPDGKFRVRECGSGCSRAASRGWSAWCRV
jgi:hypothetical protein